LGEINIRKWWNWNRTNFKNRNRKIN